MPSSNSASPNAPQTPPSRKGEAATLAQIRKGALVAIFLFLLGAVGFTLWKTDVLPRLIPKILFLTAKPPVPPIVPVNAGEITPAPLAPGKQTYRIQRPGGKSEVSEITLDPLDAQLGETQTVSVKPAGGVAIKSISITITTEQGETKHSLTKSGESLWTGSWPTTQLHDKLYGARIDVTTEGGIKPVDLWFR